MVLCFKCEPQTKRLLDELINKGAYLDYSELIAAAVQNLAVLEEAVPKSDGAVVLQQGPALVPDVIAESLADSEERLSEQVPPESKHPIAVPHIFTRTSLTSDPPEGLPDGPFSNVDDMTRVPLDKWVFGQF